MRETTAGRAGAGVVPERLETQDLETQDTDGIAHSLARDGAVVLTGGEPSPRALTVAAALALGERLRRLFPQRMRTSSDGSPVHLHADSFDVVVDVAGVPVRRRHPDEDYALVQLTRRPSSGGESFVADAYRFVDALRTEDPELWEFLTQADVDFYGAWAGLRGLPSTPRAGRHVEYTRTGRRIVRRTDGAVPLHRDPDAEHIEAMLRRFGQAVRELEGTLPRFALEKGDILLVDNYRCWHGRDAHEGERTTRILTVLTADAR
ncbi:alpha-ketoglutarate-dependent taurine dioxygenase [Streptomyces sp. Amel2xB2]|uniref:TauD/TfdA family dioxygenase n=1 Tax=Streptomyces sp. Amel2xB2 TaxID=1305829 RepID=UPI000DBA1F1E|nr:TauD/TfdA family dioxygenase [Streptomyces sp. Amel2xB2]RAJ59091.1 alpha-ketoglutarate-dependent taurine dioxygenase [Streptomyces sp. Amel2xB2]